MMNLVFSLVTFAQAEPNAFGSVLRNEKAQANVGEFLLWFGVLVAVLCSVWLVRYVRARLSCEGAGNHPRKLFRALAQAHGLDANEQRLLALLARAHNLAQPSDIFLQPTLIDVARLGPEFAGQTPIVESLRARLFA